VPWLPEGCTLPGAGIECSPAACPGPMIDARSIVEQILR
jgi:hypothetical protein